MHENQLRLQYWNVAFPLGRRLWRNMTLQTTRSVNLYACANLLSSFQPHHSDINPIKNISWNKSFHKTLLHYVNSTQTREINGKLKCNKNLTICTMHYVYSFRNALNFSFFFFCHDLNVLSCLSQPFTLYHGSMNGVWFSHFFFREKSHIHARNKQKHTQYVWLYRMNFTLYLTISFLSISVCLTDLYHWTWHDNGFSSSPPPIRYFTTCIGMYLPWTFNIMCPLSVYLTDKKRADQKKEKKRKDTTIEHPVNALSQLCYTRCVCIEYFVAPSWCIFSHFFFHFCFFFSLPLAFTWIIEHEHNHNELKLTWRNPKSREKKVRMKQRGIGATNSRCLCVCRLIRAETFPPEK